MLVTEALILKYFPCKKPYCFIDEILEIDADHILAAYTFKKTEFFFKGHFPGNPVVPGAILQEAAAQIGLLAFGMYLFGNGIEVLSDLPVELPSELQSMKIEDWSIKKNGLNHLFYLTSADMSYKKIVKPTERILVRSEKVFFRLNKLKCKVRIVTEQDELVGKGILSGIVLNANQL